MSHWSECIRSHSIHPSGSDLMLTTEVTSLVQKYAWLDPIKYSVAVAVWKKFSLCPVTHHGILVNLLGYIVKQGTVHQFKEAVSLGEITPTEGEQLLAQCSNSADASSKVVKWLCSRVLRPSSSDEPALVTRALPSIYAIFVDMLSRNKRSCVEWLSKKFHLELPNVIAANQKRSSRLVDVATWKLMLKIFPDLDRDVAVIHFLDVVSASPQHSQLTIDKLGVTQEEILFYCSTS
ncbi:hypothetical protein Pelo_1388 [Pelomyxa schiedti]|nr:hypothetical protein Pelo_1388 [Pelomyxa schiedti]